MITQHEKDIAELQRVGFEKLPQATRDQMLAHETSTLARGQTRHSDHLRRTEAPKKYRKVGDLVGLTGARYAGRTFKVLKVNPATYLLEPMHAGVQVRASHELVTDPPVTQTEAGTAQDVPLPDPIAHLVCGTVVRVHGLRGDRRAGGLTNGCLGVVLVDKGERVNVALLGGFEDRYGRLPRTMLTVVEPRDVIPWP
jgi:hypothetical protein